MDDLISRRAAIDALKGLPTWWADEGGYYGGVQPPMVALLDPEDAVSAIENLPPAEPKTGRDCTEFVRWLMDEVMDEENWQLNAVANGEIICRKLKKLGLLDVVDGYYVETQKTGEWIHDGYDFPHGNDWIHCSECGKRGINVPADLTNFCPNCGADMRGDSE